jgi:ribosomal protein S18 acetylase RimI-like enzyme
MTNDAPTVAPPVAADRPGWEVLYQGYRRHYGQPPDRPAADVVWSWITRDDAPLEGRVARGRDGEVVGLIHFRAVPRPLHGAIGGYVDDMFVAETARGSGIAEALIEAVKSIGRERGWSDVRWVTSDDNYRARGFYDRIGRRTMMLTYEIRLDARAG